MYVIQNALKNIFRNIGRNLLMGIILFSIILAAAVSIIISTTTGEIIRDYKTQFGSEILFSYDTEKMPSGEEFHPLTPQQLVEFGKSELLKSKSYFVSIPVRPTDLQSIGQENSKENMPTAMLICTDNISGGEDFMNGLREIVKGTSAVQVNECVISQQYAEQNKLDIGDTVTVENYNSSNPMLHKLKVVGIFTITRYEPMQILAERN